MSTPQIQQQTPVPPPPVPPLPVPPPAVHAPEHRYRSVLLQLLWGFASICILGVILALGQFFWLFAWTQGTVDAGAFARGHDSYTVSAALSSPELQKAVEAAVDASIKREELLLDKLLLVVGLYSAILSVLALATVFASRQDAKEQFVSLNAKADALSSEVKERLATIESDAKGAAEEQLKLLKGKADALASAFETKLTKMEGEAKSAVDQQLSSVGKKTEDLASTVETKLNKIDSDAKVAVDKLIARVESEFPSISRLQERVQKLILDLEDRFPEDENLNRHRPDSWQSEEQQQNSLIDESKILAVSVVALDSASLLKLYLALARFYFDRFNTGQFTDSDAARAYVYASRAIKDSPLSADAYRMRGATTLARYTAPLKTPRRPEEAEELLQLARADFNRCIELDPFNAGAFYNLALMSSYEYHNKIAKPDEAIPCLDRAIQLSQDLIAVEDRVPRKAQEKYLPDVYINFACFVAYKSKIATDPAVQSQMYDWIVKICKEGRAYLITKVKSAKAMDNFQQSLRRELDTKGDFAGLPTATKAALEALLLLSPDN
jgi:hypothetical protein